MLRSMANFLQKTEINRPHNLFKQRLMEKRTWYLNVSYGPSPSIYIVKWIWPHFFEKNFNSKEKNHWWYDGLQSQKHGMWKKNGDKTTTGSQNMEAHSNQPATGHHRTLPSMDLCTSNHDGDNKMPSKCVAIMRNRSRHSGLIYTCTISFCMWTCQPEVVIYSSKHEHFWENSSKICQYSFQYINHLLKKKEDTNNHA